jgi:signal transduction histidine kinase
MSLSKEKAAVISDRRRLWEVRKYCQVRPVLGRNNINGGKSLTPDVALSSLLQLLVNRLDADIAMISLLDEKTQFFLAGAQKDASEPSVESATWFGCDQISHLGGLCERTIAIDSTHGPAIYEELDMTRNTRTKDLPYVSGSLASFRYYAGAPVKTAAGIAVGTVFVMNHQPSSGLDASQQQTLINTAENVMHQLTLHLHALEGERLSRFQNTTTAVLRRQQPSLPKQKLSRKLSGLNQQPNYVLEIYEHAAEVMRQSLELDCVFFQHVSAGDRTAQTASQDSQDSQLAVSLKPGCSQPTCLSQSEVNKTIQTFPHGAVVQHLDHDWLMSSSEESQTLLDSEIRAALDRCFQGAQQLLIMPLFDVLHNRTAAICVGWLCDYVRVYSHNSDLPFVSAFCMSTISEALRIETQMLERVKSDFLGSVSHEMKTPLHQTLGNLELLLQTSCSDEQYDFAVNARFGATQLLETIDKILLYSSISSESGPEADAPSEIDTILDEKDVAQIIGPRSEHVAGAASPVDLIRMCEEVVEETTKRIRLLETIMSPLEQNEQKRDDVSTSDHADQQTDQSEKDPFTIVVFDASPIERIPVPRNTGFRVILENLLVSLRSMAHTTPETY